MTELTNVQRADAGRIVERDTATAEVTDRDESAAVVGQALPHTHVDGISVDRAIRSQRAVSAQSLGRPMDGAFNFTGGVRLSGGFVVGGRQAQTEAAAPATVTLEAPAHGYYPTVARDRFDSARMTALQKLINASGYPQAAGVAALIDDGDGGDLTGAGIDWLATQAGSPTTDPQDPQFWQSVHAYVAGLDGEQGDAAGIALNDAFDVAKTAEAPRAGYPTVPGGAYNNGRIENLQRVINAAGYAEATGKEALNTDGDGGDLTAAGISWLAETSGATSADPDTPEFWNAVHTYAARLDGPNGQAMRSALSEAMGREVAFEARVGEREVQAADTNAASRVSNDDTNTDPAGEFPTVNLDAKDSIRLWNLQGIVNAAGYAQETGRPALGLDGNSGPKTRAGVRWLSERIGANDPSDSAFWQALERHGSSLTGDRATEYRAALDTAKAWTQFPDVSPTSFPTVSRHIRDSSRFEALQGLINAAGYAEKTGEAPLVEDGDSGDFSLAGIDWLAEEVGSPTNDTNAPLFWAHVDKYAQNASQGVKDAFEKVRTTRSGGRRSSGSLPNNYPPQQASTVGADGVAAPGTVGYLLNGIRTMGIQPSLEAELERMARFYNVGITVWSGGQYAKGDGPRTGSNRHDYGNAADIIIHDANGRRLSHSELFKFRDYWLEQDIGSVGYGMDEGFGPRTGLHLDLFRDEHLVPPQGRSWTY